MLIFLGSDMSVTFINIWGFNSRLVKISFGKKLTKCSDPIQGITGCLDETVNRLLTIILSNVWKFSDSQCATKVDYCFTDSQLEGA